MEWRVCSSLFLCHQTRVWEYTEIHYAVFQFPRSRFWSWIDVLIKKEQEDDADEILNFCWCNSIGENLRMCIMFPNSMNVTCLKSWETGNLNANNTIHSYDEQRTSKLKKWKSYGFRVLKMLQEDQKMRRSTWIFPSWYNLSIFRNYLKETYAHQWKANPPPECSTSCKKK